MSSKNIEDVYPLSPMQEGMLFHSLHAPTSGVYVEQMLWEIHGDLKFSALEQACQQVVERHPILRTAFVWENLEHPLQAVGRRVRLPLERQDWRKVPLVDQQQQLEAFLEVDRKRGFNLSKAPLMHLTLIQQNERVYQFIWSYHHLLLDGWSLSLILKEVITFYESFQQGQDCYLQRPRPYRDYIAWLQQQDYSQAEAFWRRELKGITSPTCFRVNQTSNSKVRQATEYGEEHLNLPVALTVALRSLTQQYQLTLNTLVQGAWVLLLSYYSGEDDVVFGVTSSGRPAALPGVESMVGLFINTLPVRVKVAFEESILPWLKNFQTQQLELRQYEYTPLVKIQEWSDLPRGVPLFENIVVFENYPIEPSLQKGSSSLFVNYIRSIEQTNYPLSLIVVPGSELYLKILYDRHHFDTASINRMLGHLKTLLEGIAHHPEQRLKDLPLLTPAEEHQLLTTWNNTQTNLQHRCIHELFETQVDQSPDAVAVVYQNESLSYQELNHRADQLAYHLRKLGIRPEVRVGLCLNRSIEMLVGLLAILKAGGAYVPLDPVYPKERLAFILADAQVPVILTQQALVEELPETGAQVVCLDINEEGIDWDSQHTSISHVTAENLAYVIYTSGSTGTPKGVALNHCALNNLISWQLQNSNAPGARTLQFTSLSFDVSFQEIFSTWCSGGTLILISEELRQEPTALLSLLIDQAVERLFLPFIALQQLAEAANSQGLILHHLREIVTAGEALQITQQIACWLETLKNCTLSNHYGPSESHVVTAFTLNGSKKSWPALPPIGHPITNAEIYLLNTYLNPVPIGVPGEVYIGGISLARGYLNQPELTAETFIPNPYSKNPGARLYKTGDLASYQPDGNIQFLGRIDDQVKIRGFRIELGEIETALSQHPKVQEAVVKAWEDKPGKKHLVAYIVPNQESIPTLRELRSFLKEKLPEYMVPSAFMILDALPLTPSGKVNRRALPALDKTRPELESSFVAPQTPSEEILARIWAEVLGLERVGIYDNFFELGGDSILSIQIVARANREGLRFTTKQLFEYPVLADLATLTSTTQSFPATQATVIGSIPLSPIQQWFFELDPLEPHHWNMAVLLEVPQDLSLAMLAQIVQQLLIHHDALRLRFVRDASGWYQYNAEPDSSVPLLQVDLSTLPERQQKSTLEAIASELQASLNLSHGPLLQVALFSLGADKPPRLLIAIHHLAVDGFSWRILLEDLQTAYQQINRGEAVHLPPKTTSFKQWVEQLTEYTQSPALQQELTHWLTKPEIQIFRLPLDYPEGTNTAGSTRTVPALLSVEETQALLLQVPKAYNTQINDVLLTALVLAFERWTGSRTLVVNLEGHGREEILESVDLSRTVGWFTSVFPILLDLQGVYTLAEALKTVKEQLRRIPKRGIGYGLLRYLSQDSEIKSKLRDLPQAEVTFNYLGQFDQTLAKSSGFKMARESSGISASPKGMRFTRLYVGGMILHSRLHMDFNYSENLHQKSSIEAFAQIFLESLQSLIAHCQSPEARGRTPSDFPKAKLSQKNLDKFIAKINQADDRRVQ